MSKILKFDALVIGGGIAGLQSALDLADQDFKVAIVEKDATIGGKMIRLSKVFMISVTTCYVGVMINNTIPEKFSSFFII